MFLLNFKINLRYKYVIADEVEVKKYGLSSVFLNYLDKKVYILCLHFHLFSYT